MNLVLEQGIQKVVVRGAVPLPQLEFTLSTERALIVEGLLEKFVQRAGVGCMQAGRQICLKHFRSRGSGLK